MAAENSADINEFPTTGSELDHDLLLLTMWFRNWARCGEEDTLLGVVIETYREVTVQTVDN